MPKKGYKQTVEHRQKVSQNKERAIKIGLAKKGKSNWKIKGDNNPMKRPEIREKFIGRNNPMYGKHIRKNQLKK